MTLHPILQDIISFNEAYNKQVKPEQYVVRVQNEAAKAEIIYVLSTTEVLIHFVGVAHFGEYYQLLKARKAVDLFATRQSDRLKKSYDVMKYDFARRGYQIYRGEQLEDLPTHHTFMIGIPKAKWHKDAHDEVISTICQLRQQELKISEAIGGYTEQTTPTQISLHPRAKERITTYIEEAATFADTITVIHNEQFIKAVLAQIPEKMTRTTFTDKKTIQLQSIRYTIITNMYYMRIISNHNAAEEKISTLFSEELYKLIKQNQRHYLKLQDAQKQGLKSSRNELRCERISRLLQRYFQVQRFACTITYQNAHTLLITGKGLLPGRAIHLLVHPDLVLAVNETIMKNGQSFPTLSIIYQLDKKPSLHLFEGQGLTNGHGVEIFSIYMLAKDTRKVLNY
ncbi:MAG TPA: hypothetical protein K8V30_09550 [Metalysinibacillus jejuensis]|uniref:Uncharacterized protein n=1 Tax=Metalysinibacillus jejuensis TaxID=914327 RepID=A0A921NDI6_9BACL|nr:hypothetical protein [Metalysinibacillus jejuensis]HJH11911.1 hypothetical protein [Metalysinibacillus jejuensis]